MKGAVYKVLDSEMQKQVSGRCNISVHFVSPELVVVSSGAGKLHIVHTGARDGENGGTWKACCV